MTVERIHPKAPVMLIFIAIFTCLPSCINLSNIETCYNMYYCDNLKKQQVNRIDIKSDIIYMHYYDEFKSNNSI